MDDTGVKKTLRNFAETTTVKGIPRVLKSERRFLSILWFLALMCGAAVGFTNLYLLIRQYFRYETSTKLSMCNDCRPPFPDITLCNLNPFNSMPNTSWTFAEYTDHIQSVMNPNFDIHSALNELGITVSQLNQMGREATSMAGYFQNLNYSLLLNSYDKWSKNAKFIAGCQWYGWNGKEYTNEDCNTQSVHTIYNSEYFMCHTIQINHSIPESDNREVAALHVLLYLNDFTNRIMPLEALNIHHSQAKGVRMVVHPSYTLPEMYKGININPGKEVQVHLSASEIVRKPEPYSECTDKVYLEEVEDIDMSGLKRYKYSDSACIALCNQQHNLDLCGCINPRLPYSKELSLLFPEAQFCGKFTSNTTDNLRRYSCYMFNDTSLNKSCDCPLQCEEFVYDYQTFSSAWPHESYQYMFYKNFIKRQPYKDKFKDYSPLDKMDIEKQSDEIFQILNNKYLIRKNFISLKVLFQERGHAIYEQKPTMTKSNFWGMTGGVLNLWIGITFFTLIELIDLLYKLGEVMFHRNKRRKNSEGAKDDIGE